MTEVTEVYVRRHPSDWQTATWELNKIEGLRWDFESGGVGRRTSHPALFGYVWCDDAIDGEIAHACAHGPGPHRIKVCLPKGLNKEVWPAIMEFAGLG